MDFFWDKILRYLRLSSSNVNTFVIHPGSVRLTESFFYQLGRGSSSVGGLVLRSEPFARALMSKARVLMKSVVDFQYRGCLKQI